MAYCLNCGAELAESDKFCPSCGTAVGGVQAQAATASVTAQQPGMSAGSIPQTGMPSDPGTFPMQGPPPSVAVGQPTMNLSMIFNVVAFVFVGLAVISVALFAIYEDDDALIVSAVFWFLAFIFFVVAFLARSR